MARALAIWIVASLVGLLLLLLLPEDLLGRGALFRLSDRHGPGPADSVGLAVALAGWAVFLTALLRRWRSIRPRWAARLLAAVTIAASAACVMAIANDRNVWGLVLGALALAAQVALALMAIAHDQRSGTAPRTAIRETKR